MSSEWSRREERFEALGRETVEADLEDGSRLVGRSAEDRRAARLWLRAKDAEAEEEGRESGGLEASWRRAEAVADLFRRVQRRAPWAAAACVAAAALVAAVIASS